MNLKRLSRFFFSLNFAIIIFMKNNKTLIWIGLVIIVIVGLFVFQRVQPGAHDELAQCLREKGTFFYGAFWCPACAEQKSVFGNSERLLPYIECSTPNRQGQTQICIDEEITSYPTWEFPDETRQTGVLQPSQLAKLSGCEL
jgi:hypothetical protein